MSARVQPAAGLVLRPYRAADRPACERIYVEARRKAFWWCDPGRFVTADFALDSSGEAMTVASVDGCVAGFVSLWLPDHFIHLLFVEPALHRRGIGSALLAHAMRRLSPWAWLKCQAQNETALAFYRSQGWVVGGGGTNDIGPWVAVSWNAANRDRRRG